MVSVGSNIINKLLFLSSELSYCSLVCIFSSSKHSVIHLLLCSTKIEVHTDLKQRECDWV